MALYNKYSTNHVNNGRMNDPTAAAWIKGLCGDTMEIYLTIRNNRIVDIKYHTDGCSSTHACGSLISILAKNRSIRHALSLNPGLIIKKLKDLPEENHHCAILAISALHKAIADYIIRFNT